MYKNFRERGIPRLLRLPQGGAVFDFRGAVAVLTVPHRDIPYSGLTTRTTISWPDARHNPGTLHGMQYELVLTSVK